MSLSRRDIIAAVQATEPQGTPQEYAVAVLGSLYPGMKDWSPVDKPVWSALWLDGEDCGFVSKVVVNDPTTFLSTDAHGRDRRLPVAGKRFLVLPACGG